MTEENTRFRITGHKKLRLIRELAAGEKTHAVLSREYGVTSRTIANFVNQHQVAISECIRALDDEFMGLWITSQVSRMAEYESLAERLDEIIFDADSPASVVATAIQKKALVLRNVAEERGHLLQKVETSGKYNYAVEGVDLTKLGG